MVNLDSLIQFARKTLGGEGSGSATTPAARPAPVAAPTAAALSDQDRRAIARYDYLLETAEPHQLEAVNREAFAALTPEQRAAVGDRLRADLPATERPATDEPSDLARSATRSEMSRPGRLRGLLAKAVPAGAAGVAVGGAGAAVGVLGAVAGGAIVSTVAAPLLAQAADLGVDFEALASGLDVEGILGGVDLSGIELGGLAEGAEQVTSGLGEQLGGLGETISGLNLGDLGGLRDLFK